MLRRSAGLLFARSAPALCTAAPSRIPPVTRLTEEEVALVNSVRDFAQKEIKPVTHEMDEAARMKPEFIKSCFGAGLMGIETAEEYKGTGMTFFASILTIEELAKVDPAVSVMVDVQNTLVNNIFFRFANEELKKKFLPKLATDSVGCFCLSEPAAGSDAFALKTRAEKVGNDYVINGSKCFITNGGEADIFLIMANVDPSAGYRGITCFAVDRREFKGVEVGRRELKMGIRASSTCELRFENLVVPESHVVGEVGKGYKIAIETLNEGRIGIGAQMLGIAQGALDAAMPYLFERKQFKTNIGDFQGMQFQYAKQAMDIQAARLMVYNAARKKEAGENFVEDAAMAKLFASKVAEETASKAIEWCGGLGFMRDFGVERFYRDAKIGAIYEGTTNIQLATIAKMVKAKYVK